MSTRVKYSPRRKGSSGVKPLPARRGPMQRWPDFDAPKLVVGGSLAALEAKLAGIRQGVTV